MNFLADQFNAEIRIAKLNNAYQTANVFLFGAERIVVIWMGALSVLDSRFSIGMLFAFISYKDQFSLRTASLIDKLFDLKMLRLHGERVADIVLTDPEVEQHADEVDMQSVSPEFLIKDLVYRYAQDETTVLNGISFFIPAGQCIAITGASGCGKTALVKLLLGLMDPTSGSIHVGGGDLKKLGVNNYRQMAGTVMQEDILFAGSISDNISFFDPIPDLARVAECARLASISSEIGEMPMGYNTLAGDIGTGLSGGQKQRVLLARALYKNPKILVLDEATSHLDTTNERHVNAAIKRLSLTRIIVAHRPETIGMADRVIVLEKGHIVRDYYQSQSTAISQPLSVVASKDGEI